MAPREPQPHVVSQQREDNIGSLNHFRRSSLLGARLESKSLSHLCSSSLDDDSASSASSASSSILVCVPRTNSEKARVDSCE